MSKSQASGIVYEFLEDDPQKVPDKPKETGMSQIHNKLGKSPKTVTA